MDLEKMKKWLELTNQYKSDTFWNSIFDHRNSSHFFDGDGDDSDSFPKVDIYQNDTHIWLILDAPGLSKDDITFSLSSNTKLLIKGISKQLYPKEMGVTLERFYGEFERTIQLPEPTDAKSISIQFFNGLIQIAFPRRIEAISIHDT